MNIKEEILSAGWTPDSGQTGAAQIVDGEWHAPKFGCDSLSNSIEAAEQVLDRERSKREWYQNRIRLLSMVQSHMRDPERELVCDILANGQLLPDPDGGRYGFPTTGTEHLIAAAKAKQVFPSRQG